MKVTSSPLARQTSDNAKGILLVLVSTLFFALAGLGVRLSKDFMRADSLVLYRCVFQTLILLPWVGTYFRSNGSWKLSRRIQFHLLRSGFGICSMLFFYQALHRLPLALAGLLLTTSAFWATLMSRFFLNEKWTRAQLGCASIIMVGIFLSFWDPRPQQAWTLSIAGIVFGLLGALSRGGALTALRRLRMELGTREIVFCFGIVGTVVTLPSFLLDPQIPQSLSQWGWVGLVAVSATLGQIFRSAGFRFTTTLNATAVSLQGTVLNVALGFLVLSEVPPLTFLLALVLVMAGNIGLVLRGGGNALKSSG